MKMALKPRSAGEEGGKGGEKSECHTECGWVLRKMLREGRKCMGMGKEHGREKTVCDRAGEGKTFGKEKSRERRR